MEELDILKKNWQTREQEFPKVSYKEIYAMLLKKSSSMVGWIFYISIGEILLWIALYFLIPESSKQFQIDMGLGSFNKWFTVINLLVVVFFIVLFYKNHIKIKSTSSIKELMKNILKTRKTVHLFVYYNLIISALLVFFTNLYYFLNKEKLVEALSHEKLYAGINVDTFIGANVIAGIIILGLLVIFYALIYGLLLKRLKRNFKELQKIEV